VHADQVLVGVRVQFGYGKLGQGEVFRVVVGLDYSSGGLRDWGGVYCHYYEKEAERGSGRGRDC